MSLFIIWVNQIINILKYPIAVLFFLLTFQLFDILYNMVEVIYYHYIYYKPLLIGMGSYFVLWLFVFRNIRGNWFLTIEHELTHTLFALLTFHKIVDFKASNSSGGYMQYSGVGNGNWLITIAPYFFPTFSMIVIGFLYFAQSQYYFYITILLGYSISYHIHSTWTETDNNQPDIQEVGLTFAWLFLPSANMLALITIISAIPYDRFDFIDIIHKLYNYILIIISQYSIWIEKINKVFY